LKLLLPLLELTPLSPLNQRRIGELVRSPVRVAREAIRKRV
jgi:hypothetical protein